MSEPGPAPTSVSISFYGEPWMVDLSTIRIRMAELDANRVALAFQQGAAGARVKTRGYRGWAKELGISHMTLRRLLEAKPISLECFNVILAGLGLDFKTVAVPAGPWRGRGNPIANVVAARALESIAPAPAA